jgi:hypothetical protein
VLKAGQATTRVGSLDTLKRREDDLLTFIMNVNACPGGLGILPCI